MKPCELAVRIIFGYHAKFHKVRSSTPYSRSPDLSECELALHDTIGVPSEHSGSSVVFVLIRL
jgi:hypothetical protein